MFLLAGLRGLRVRALIQSAGRAARAKDFADKRSWRETKAGRAAEWQQSREIKNDLQAKEKWLSRAQADADERWRRRERRLANNHRDLGSWALSDLSNGGADEDKQES